MKISLTTIGCKLNQAEIQALKTELNNLGYFIVDKNQPHDLHIINACSITTGAEQITRQKIREIKRRYPKTQVFIFGCISKQNLIPEIDRLFKTKEAVLKYLKNFPSFPLYPLNPLAPYLIKPGP